MAKVHQMVGGPIRSAECATINSTSSLVLTLMRLWISSNNIASHSYLVDPASSHMLVSKIKPCMSKYKHYTVKLRMAH